MKIRMQNIGPLKDATIEMGKLTVLTGTNNTGKTYAMYTMWGALEKSIVFDGEYKELKFISKYADSLINERAITINMIDLLKEYRQDFLNYFNKNLNNSLNSLFNMDNFLSKRSDTTLDLDINKISLALNELNFDFDPNIGFIIDHEYNAGNVSIKINNFDNFIDPDEDLFDKNGDIVPKDKQKDVQESKYNYLVNSFSKKDAIEYIGDCLVRAVRLSSFNVYHGYASPLFFIPASRTGINLTFQEVTKYKSNLLQEMRRPVRRVKQKLLEQRPVSAYSEPVESYMEMLSDYRYNRINNEDSDTLKFLQEKISKVKYNVDEKGNVSGTPLNSKQIIPLYLLSSTSNSLYGLWLWLQLHRNRKSGFLMIDEPELNLHPENQILLARLLVRLVKSGIHVAISTHSDYIVREISNMMMLHEDFPDRAKLAEAYDYDLDNETINPADVKAFHFTTEGDHAVVTPCEISNPGGIVVPSMDNTIKRQNSCYDALFDKILAQQANIRKPKKP